MTVTVKHDDDRQELIVRLGGAVRQVGGPPAILRSGPHRFDVLDLAFIAGAVALVADSGKSAADWRVSDPQERRDRPSEPMTVRPPSEDDGVF